MQKWMCNLQNGQMCNKTRVRKGAAGEKYVFTNDEHF